MTREGLFYHIMVDMDERPKGWNKELYDQLSFEYLIKCIKNGKIKEWNQAYEAYLRSEWERILPDEEYDLENIQKLIDYSSLFDHESDFLRPDYSDLDLNNLIQEEKNFSFAHLEGADFSYAHLGGVDFSAAYLDGVRFWRAHLEGVRFTHTRLKRADFFEADLEEAQFWRAGLDGAYFYNAHLEGANFRNAHLKGAIFVFTIVNGETIFTDNTIDTQTNFIGTSLSSARIDPELRTKLERNIRQIHWEKWYAKPKLYPDLAKIKNALIVKFSAKKSPEKKKWETKRCWVDRIINVFVRTFWWISNYGCSTKRIIGVFFGWNILWAFIYYYLLPFLPGINTTVLNVSNIGAAILQTNLMMFSITDLATEGLDILPMLFVTIHIVIGYFILAALITRLGIMFQNLSP